MHIYREENKVEKKKKKGKKTPRTAVLAQKHSMHVYTERGKKRELKKKRSQE